jgi:hypothetical protein
MDTMKNMLALVGLTIVLVGGVGYFLGWYKIGTAPAADGHQKIEVDVDANKVKHDVKEAEKKVGEVVGRNVPGTTTGLQKDGDWSIPPGPLPPLPDLPPPPRPGSSTDLPPLPPLPPPPSPAPLP